MIGLITTTLLAYVHYVGGGYIAPATTFTTSNPRNIYGIWDLPPKKFDHFPWNKTMFINLDLNNDLQTLCAADNGGINKNVSYLGCEFNVTGDNLYIFPQTELVVGPESAIDKLRLVNFIAGLKPKEAACVVILPFEWQVTHQSMNHTYRHELGHCNGWPAWHPDAVNNRPKDAED